MFLLMPVSYKKNNIMIELRVIFANPLISPNMVHFPFFFTCKVVSKVVDKFITDFLSI
jgi:hypothetical protein